MNPAYQSIIDRAVTDIRNGLLCFWCCTWRQADPAVSLRMDELYLGSNSLAADARACAVAAHMPDKPSVLTYKYGAQYLSLFDVIRIPPPTAFFNTAGYYHILFHELVHSTGHPKRLNRPAIATSINDSIPNNVRVLEELTAELGALMLCNATRIKTDIDNSIRYMRCHLSSFEGDGKPELIYSIADDAAAAADYILGKPLKFSAGLPNY